MAVLRFILVFIEVASSLLLIGVILLQKTKSQGIGMAFGAGMGEALFGARVGNVLTRATVILSVVFLVNTTILAYVGASRRVSSVADKSSPSAPARTPMRAPGMPQPAPAPGMTVPAGTEPLEAAPIRIPSAGAEPPAGEPPAEPAAADEGPPTPAP